MAETETADSIERLKRCLQAEREAHKATKTRYLAPIRSALGLGEDANLDAVTAALRTRLGDVDAQLTARTESLSAERDSARAELERMRAERNTERTERAITEALAKSGIIAQNADDAATILRGVLEVTDKGEVRTKAAPNVVPGQTPEQFIAGQLRTLRPHYWPASVGGGARSVSGIGHVGPDISCFRAGGTLTDQFRLVGTIGAGEVRAALKRAGITVPRWLNA